MQINLWLGGYSNPGANLTESLHKQPADNSTLVSNIAGIADHRPSVINYDVPDHPENYGHRTGRTARFDADRVSKASRQSF